MTAASSFARNHSYGSSISSPWWLRAVDVRAAMGGESDAGAPSVCGERAVESMSSVLT
jgi:hypothetical protein